MVSNQESMFYELKCKEGTVLQISWKAAQRSVTLVNYLKLQPVEDGAENALEPCDLFNVSEKVAKQVIKWCEDHRDTPLYAEDPRAEKSEAIKKLEKELLEDLNGDEIWDLLEASKYLDVECLRNTLLKMIAHQINGKNYKEIREIWRLTSGFTPEEEAEIATEDSWKVLEEEVKRQEAESGNSSAD